MLQGAYRGDNFLPQTRQPQRVVFGRPDEHWAAQVSLDAGDLRSQTKAGYPEGSSGGCERFVRSDVGWP